MITDTFHNSHRATVADTETLGGFASEECLSTRRTVQTDIPDNNIVLGRKPSASRRRHDDPTARKTLADIIIRITLEINCDTVCEPRTETLSSRASQSDHNGVIG